MKKIDSTSSAFCTFTKARVFIKPTSERIELIDQPILVGSNTGANPDGARAKTTFESRLDF